MSIKRKTKPEGLVIYYESKSSPFLIKTKRHPFGCLFVLVGEAGLDLRFRPGMDENYGVPAVEPAGSNGPPDRCI